MPETSFVDATSVRPIFDDDTRRNFESTLVYRKPSRVSGIEAAGFNSNQRSSSGDFELTQSNVKKQVTGNSTNLEVSLSPAAGNGGERLNTGNFPIDTNRLNNTARDSAREVISGITAELEPNLRASAIDYEDPDDPRGLLCSCRYQDPKHEECECIDGNTGANYSILLHIQEVNAAALARWEREIRATYQGGDQFDWDALAALEKVDDQLELDLPNGLSPDNALKQIQNLQMEDRWKQLKEKLVADKELAFQ